MNKTKKIVPMYGLPREVKFCSNCLMSNQRPNSAVEFNHNINTKKETISFDKNNICDACRANSQKEKIDWNLREKELIKLLDKYRSKDGSYDCLVPGSGGKDSAFQAHILKYKYGMNPLTYTWPPILYTDYGYENWKNWIEVGGFDNISFKPNGRVMKKLTKLAIENIFHPFQTFFFGQKNLAPKIASQMGIPLVFYGENEAEYGNPIADNNTSIRNRSIYASKNMKDIYLSGISLKELREKHDLGLNDLSPFLPPSIESLEKSQIEVHYLGYYLRWTPQEVYYYATENTGFKPRPFRSQGSYSKYNSIDDKIDDLHFYTTYIKFGIGRTTYEGSQEIRNNHITRDEGIALVKKYDGEFPDKYFQEIMDYLEIDSEFFKEELTDKFRSPHLWVKMNGKWKLRNSIHSGKD